MQDHDDDGENAAGGRLLRLLQVYLLASSRPLLLLVNRAVSCPTSKTAACLSPVRDRPRKLKE